MRPEGAGDERAMLDDSLAFSIVIVAAIEASKHGRLHTGGDKMLCEAAAAQPMGNLCLFAGLTSQGSTERQGPVRRRRSALATVRSSNKEIQPLRGDVSVDYERLVGPKISEARVKASFVIEIDVDAVALEEEGKHRGLTLARTLECVLADVEGRLTDSVRLRPCVARVGSRLLDSKQQSIRVNDVGATVATSVHSGG